MPYRNAASDTSCSSVTVQSTYIEVFAPDSAQFSRAIVTAHNELLAPPQSP